MDQLNKERQIRYLDLRDKPGKSHRTTLLRLRRRIIQRAGKDPELIRAQQNARN